MAAVAPPPSNSTFGPWASSSSAAYPTVPPSMTDIMSYQYPPPPPNGADMDMPPSGYLPSYSVPPHASSGMDPDSSLPSRERSDLRRSISTPVVGPSQSQGQPQQPPTPQQSAASQDAAAERRRNKLGYHRTSVACGKYPPSVLRQALDAKTRRRPLSSPKDSVCPVAKRCPGTVHQLHSPEEGMQLLPRRSTASSCRHETEVGITIIRRSKGPLCLSIAVHATGNSVRHARAAALPSIDHAVNSNHGASDEAFRERQLPPRLQE